MKTDKTQIGIVVESYNRGENQVVTARTPDLEMHHFFYLPKYPDINLGDTLILNFHNDKFFVHHGNPNLTYRIIPLVFPDTLLLELIMERMNQ